MTAREIEELGRQMQEKIDSMSDEELQRRIDKYMERRGVTEFMTKETVDRMIEEHERLIGSMTLEEAKRYYASFGLELREDKWKEYNEKYSEKEVPKSRINRITN